VSEQITLTNVGPIESLSFQLQDHGLTVLTAPNGSGKTIALSAIQALARGSGKVPLRDGARKGSVDAGGAIITVGSQCRHSGQFDIVNLEGRFDLATLVDPKLKSADAADRQRIKALVGLTGTKASRTLFEQHEAFKDTFGTVVAEASTQTDDLTEMASRIKRDYEGKARAAEEEAQREEGSAAALEKAGADLDLNLPSDQVALQAAYDAARDEYTRVSTLAEQYVQQQQAADKASADLGRLQEQHSGTDANAAAQALVEANDRMVAQQRLISKLQNDLANAEALADQLTQQWRAAQQAKIQADNYESLRLQYEQTIAAFTPGKAIDVDGAQQRMQEAAEAHQRGAVIREAKRKIGLAQEHKSNAAKARERAFHLREIAGTTDEVLSSAIKCDALRVESMDGAARLVVDHPQRGVTPYHELSEGERWKTAIDLGVSQVGEGGLLVIPQEAFESLDVFVRETIHEHAKTRKVYILTAEATRDEADGRAMHARPFAEVSNG
jgi:ABC-type molybdenum transport system ATPase subunit/photorepair protein PhrA